MQFINGLTILMVYQLFGEITVRYFTLPIPGPVLGMLMLFVILAIRGKVDSTLEKTATGLLSHLSLLFIPAGVGMMVHFDRIANEWVAISVALALSTIITLIGSAAIMTMVSKFVSDTRASNKENS